MMLKDIRLSLASCMIFDHDSKYVTCKPLSIVSVPEYSYEDEIQTL